MSTEHLNGCVAFLRKALYFCLLRKPEKNHFSSFVYICHSNYTLYKQEEDDDEEEESVLDLEEEPEEDELQPPETSQLGNKQV